MRQYLLDEIARNDLPRVRQYLKEHATASSLADIWWVDLPEDLLSPEQFARPRLPALPLRGGSGREGGGG